MHIELLTECSVMIRKLIRQHFLTLLLRDPAPSSSELTNDQLMSLPEPCRLQPAIAVIHTDGGMLRMPHERQGLQDYLEQHNGENFVFVSMEGNRIGCLFPYDECARWQEIYQSIVGLFPFPIRIGVGECCQQIGAISQSYRQAMSVLYQTNDKGSGVMYYSPDNTNRLCMEHPLFWHKKIIDEFMGKCNESTLRAYVNSFCKALFKESVSDLVLAHSMTIRLLVKLEQLAHQETDAFGFPALPLVEITHMEQMIELESKVCRMVMELKQFVEQNRPHTDDHNIVENSIQYMMRNVAHATLQSTAGHVFVTPNYLSMLFKSRTGKTFIDTLTDLRIQEAMRLIKETRLKYSEISLKVGYQDPRYFGKIFKLKTDMTPSEFKQMQNSQVIYLNCHLESREVGHATTS